MNLIEITDEKGRVIAPEWLRRSETVHRQLRPQLPAAYAEKMQRVFDGGGRMLVAADGVNVLGLAVYRIQENTHANLHLYVDDLITDETQRSKGIGHALLLWLEQAARAQGCHALTLDSGTQRFRAHAFYFRERMAATAFHFHKGL